MSNNNLSSKTYSHDPVVNKGRYLVRDFTDELASFDSSANAQLLHNSIQVVPKSGLNGVFAGTEQPVEYQIDNMEEVCHFKKMSIRAVIKNDDAVNPALVLPGQFLVSYHNFLCGGQSNETVYNYHTFYNDIYLADSDEKVRNIQTLTGFTGGIGGTPYSDTISIPASGSAVVYINLENALTKTCMFVTAIKQTIQLRCYFSSTGMLSTSTSSGISLLEADLLIEGIHYDDVVKTALLRRYETMDHIFPYYEPQRVLISSQPLSDTNKTSVKITELGGMLSSQLVVLIVPQNAQFQNMYDFQQVSKLNLFKNGRSIGSFQDQPSDWVIRQMAQMFNVTAVTSQNVYVLSQSKTPVDSANYGLQRGDLMLSNNNTMEIQMASGGAGTYDIYILCYRFDNVILNTAGRVEYVQIM